MNPDDYAVDTSVSNISPYFTLVSAGKDNVAQGFEITAVRRNFSVPGDNIFAHAGVGFFNENRRMRMDFYHPVLGVSIDFIGNDSRPTYGRLEIFNSANQSLGWVRTDSLGNGQKQRLALNSPGIAWALAYPEDSYLNSSPFGILENLEVTVPEQSTVTDAKGNYSFPSLPASNYLVTATQPNDYFFVYPNNNGTVVTLVTGTNDAIANFGVQGTKPPTLTDQTVRANELLAGGSVVATLPVLLGYPTQRLKYTILSGDPDNQFTIDAAKGQLLLQTTSLDFESRPSYQLNIKLEDTGNADLNDTALIQLQIEDANEPPVALSKSASVSELTTNGTVVTTMTAQDPDAGPAGTLVWGIVSGNVGNAFAIDSTTGTVTVQDATKIDFEQLASYAILVRVFDLGTPPYLAEAILNISVSNVNEAPVLSGQALAISENSLAGTTAGTASASDPDRNQALQWQILGGSGLGVFEINASNGDVKLATGAKVNFEQTAEYTLDVQVTDSGSPALSTTRSIRVVIVDDNDAPTIVESTFSIPENAGAGRVVGTVDGRDEDSSQTISYVLSGNDAASFVIDQATGELRTAADKQFDFETKKSYRVVVTATDNGEVPKSVEATVTVNLTDLNEAPVISTSQLGIAENSAAGSQAGSLTAQDPDAGDTVRWSIISQSVNWVTLNEQTGALNVVAGANIDYEGTRESLLVVRATDAAGLSSNTTVTLTAVDRNEPPTVATANLGSPTIKVDTPYSYTLPANTFSDPDANDQLNMFVTLASGFPLPGWLSYDRATRVLSGTPTSNDGGSVAVKFTAIDQGGASASATLTINVSANLWHNSNMAFDVTGDSLVTARDALLVINYLNTIGPGAVPSNSQPVNGYLDTSGDNSVTARDALLVINEINQKSSGEGESAVDLDFVTKRTTKLGLPDDL